MQIKNNFIQFRLVKEDKEYIYIKGTSGPAKEVRISKHLTPELYFLAGIILGDGHLDKDIKRITLELTDREKLEKIATIFELVFSYTKIKIAIRTDKRENRKIRFYFNINNSPIYHLFNTIFGIPKGKKSDIIKVSKFIKQSNLKFRKYFLLGVFITDGGRRQGGFGLSTASKIFREDISELLFSIGIIHSKDSWINKKYKKPYYGLSFRKKQIYNMQGYQSGQMGQILDSLYEKLEGLA